MIRVDPARADGAARAFAARAERAEQLARRANAERSPLRFVAGLLRVQGEVAAALASKAMHRSLAGAGEGFDSALLSSLLEVARHTESHGPYALAAEAHVRASEDAASAVRRLALYRHGERATGEEGAARDYLSRAMLRPLVELQRILADEPARASSSGRCPFCGGAPSIAFRRTAAEGDGAARHLVCALCGLDWSFPRIRCPECGEADPEKLPSFSDDRHAGVRLESCESCRRYVKSLDVSLDAGIEPEVDDLDSLSLDLWAGERSLVRIEPGLAGL